MTTHGEHENRPTSEDPTGQADSVAPAGQHHGHDDGPHGRCRHCGTQLVTGTVDFAGTPDETAELDAQRATLLPGQMVTAAICPNPDCPGPDPDTGAEL